MTENEAVKVLKIMTTADSGCGSCARELMKKFAKFFPEHEQTAIKIFKQEYVDDYGLFSWD